MYFYSLVRSSFSRKLILSYLSIIFIPMFIGGIIFNNISAEAARKEYFNAVNTNLNQVSYNLTNKIRAFSQVAGSIVNDRTFLDFLNTNGFDDLYLVQTINDYVIARLSEIKGLNNDIHSIRIIHGNKGIPAVYDYLYYDNGMNTGEWRGKLKKLNRITGSSYLEGYIETAHKENIYYKTAVNKESIVYTSYYPIYSYELRKLLGVVEISTTQESFLQPVKNLTVGENEILTLVNRDSKLLYTNSTQFKGMNIKDIINTGNYSTVTLNGKESYYIIRQHIDFIDCWLVAYIPVNNSSAKNNTVPLIVTYLIVGFITLCLIAFFQSKLLLSNLFKLTATIRKVRKGDLDSKVDIKSMDEIGQLANDFNNMTSDLKNLMQNIEIAHIAEKEAVYKALENQIKPHFLCNALDMIRMTAETANNKEISNAIELIARYFMYNMGKTGKYVSIIEELKNVTDYIEIHNLIRNNKIRYDINISPEMRSCLDRYKIIKFTLQPVVENCIKHGFQKKKSNCYIFISINFADGKITVSIEDNGNGIEKDKLEDLVQSLLIGTNGSSNISQGIGLTNINERMRMNYGDNSKMTIESYPNVGTNIILQFPAEHYITDDSSRMPENILEGMK